MDVPVVAPSAGGVQQQGAQPAVPAVPPEPQPQVPAGQSPQSSDDGKGSLSPVVAELFSQGAILQPTDVSVTYRVERNPDEIVTVFTDPVTGKEISQVPAEVLVQIAQFFDKHSGVTLDKSA